MLSIALTETVLWPLVCFVPPEYQMKGQLVESDQAALKLNVTYQVVVYARCLCTAWKHKYVKENTQDLVDASMDIGEK
jgi:hypothetical protein